MGNVQPLRTTSELPWELGLDNEQGTNRPSLTLLGSKDGTVLDALIDPAFQIGPF